ncbi:hypothetical protein ACFQH6_09185 [Halobacteriaceae archaeon GCM10025711]
MSKTDLAAAVSDALAVDADEFQTQVEDDAEVIKRELAEGTFDNPQAIVGFEYEFYAVAGAKWRGHGDETLPALTRVPRRLLEFIGFEKELGLHNAEMSTSPQPFNAHGLAAQEAEVNARLSAALDPIQAEGMQLVSDGMWTIPPAGESAHEYLTDSVTIDGYSIATNMSASARYHAMANSRTPAGMVLDAPHVHLEADTVMPESLITSIQPHFQVPHATDLPNYFRYALRIAGPLLALGVNAPFFPPDLYDEDATADDILADGWHEHRVDVFESVLNDDGVHEKVRFPRDLETVEEAVDRIAADETMVPMPTEVQGRFDDSFAAFRLKHGTYWRWVRPVFGGGSRSSANARIEFRPIPAQPTVRDSIAFQAAFAGLLSSLRQHEHPVWHQEWETARENFYAAVRDGIDADMAWVTKNGDETTDRDELYEDLLSYARDGLQSAGLSEEETATYLWPLRQRARHGVTPAGWKRDRVRDHLDDGDPFEDAVYEMQREYVERQKETLIGGSFADWLGRGGTELRRD